MGTAYTLLSGAIGEWNLGKRNPDRKRQEIIIDHCIFVLCLTISLQYIL
jgi:hypothetical protein